MIIIIWLSLVQFDVVILIVFVDFHSARFLRCRFITRFCRSTWIENEITFIQIESILHTKENRSFEIFQNVHVSFGESHNIRWMKFWSFDIKLLTVGVYAKLFLRVRARAGLMVSVSVRVGSILNKGNSLQGNKSCSETQQMHEQIHNARQANCEETGSHRSITSVPHVDSSSFCPSRCKAELTCMRMYMVSNLFSLSAKVDARC